MASPQTKNGYTAIANELLEQIAKASLNGSQRRIIDIVWRFTYGFSRKQHELSETFISKYTGIHRKQVQRELNELIKMNFVLVVKEASFNSSRILMFNKDYESWEVTKKLPPSQKDVYTGSELATTQDISISNVNNSERSGISDLEEEVTKKLPPSRLVPQESNNIKQILKQNIYSIFEYWNSKDIIKHRNLTDKIKRKISNSLDGYSESEIKTAINNYSIVLKGDKYYWSYTWTLEEFLQKGLEKFLSSTCYENFLKKGGITNSGTYTNTEQISGFDKSKFLASTDNF